MIGVDGTRDGWITACYTGSTWDISFIPSLEQLPEKPCLIDIPLGLPATAERACDRVARSFLAPERHSSIFSCPVRDAIYAATYQEACAINERATGKRISVQAWNIVPKIREADQVRHQQLYESHPEVIFKAIAPASVTKSKKTMAGKEDRISVLDQYGDTDIINTVDTPKATTDDLIDAMALSIVPYQRLKPVNNIKEISTDGTPMQILMPDQ